MLCSSIVPGLVIGRRSSRALDAKGSHTLSARIPGSKIDRLPSAVVTYIHLAIADVCAVREELVGLVDSQPKFEPVR